MVLEQILCSEQRAFEFGPETGCEELHPAAKRATIEKVNNNFS